MKEKDKHLVQLLKFLTPTQTQLEDMRRTTGLERKLARNAVVDTIVRLRRQSTLGVNVLQA
jgi:hypothetical protein